jgi:hypothetical protein
VPKRRPIRPLLIAMRLLIAPPPPAKRPATASENGKKPASAGFFLPFRREALERGGGRSIACDAKAGGVHQFFQPVRK